jgi:hypothetical protein
MFQEEIVPEPLVTVTPTIIVLVEKDEMYPSMKLVGVPESITRTRSPAANAVAVAARFVVNVLVPVPMTTELVLVRP